MCVIAVYKQGVKLNKKELETCFKRNQDGAGYMYFTEKNEPIKGKKGYFKFSDFWRAIKDISVDTIRVFHFRIATSGLVDGARCHPFPVTSNLNTMESLDISSNYAFCHNGIISQCSDEENVYSDTMIFNKNILAPLGKRSFYTGCEQLLLSDFLGTNKLALLHSKFGLLLYGNFVTSTKSKAMYSNNTYLEPKKYYNYNNYSFYKSYYNQAEKVTNDCFYDETTGEYFYYDATTDSYKVKDEDICEHCGGDVPDCYCFCEEIDY